MSSLNNSQSNQLKKFFLLAQPNTSNISITSDITEHHSSLTRIGKNLEDAVLQSKDIGPRVSREFQYLLKEYLHSAQKKDPNDTITFQRQLLNYKLRFEDCNLNEISDSVIRLHNYMTDFMPSKKLTEDVIIKTSASLLLAINKLSAEKFFPDKNHIIDNLTLWLEPFDQINTILLLADIKSNQERYKEANHEYAHVIRKLENKNVKPITILEIKLKMAFNNCKEYTLSQKTKELSQQIENDIFDIIINATNLGISKDDRSEYNSIKLEAQYLLGKFYLSTGNENLAFRLFNNPEFKDPSFKYAKDIRKIIYLNNKITPKS